MKKMTTLILMVTALSALASYDKAREHYESGGMSAPNYRRMIIELTNGGHYFSALPLMKEFLTQSRLPLDEKLDEAFETIVAHTGVRPFETMPEKTLDQSRSSNIRYILAKRKFKRGDYNGSLAELSRVNANHPIYPFAVHLKGSAYSLQGKQEEAASFFNDCIRFSESRVGDEKDGVKIRQLLINRDYCTAGVARSRYAQKKWTEADLLYLDIPKASYIWPEILFEEAWNSYYLKQYNRTLGKLVSYNAPVFDFIFNPEIEVLRAMTYFRMCLYNDVQLITDGFYEKYLDSSKSLRTFILTRGKDYKYFYKLATDFDESRHADNSLMNSVLLSIVKDAAYQEMKQSLIYAIAELKKIQEKPNNRFNALLSRNLGEVISGYRDLIGGYTRAQMVRKYADLYRAFQSMSYIKLEVISQKKERLYRSDSLDGKKRGDIRYIERNDKQYFWDFNGEFWADELGDYVFALRSEC